MNFGGVIHLNKTGMVFICGLILIFLLYSTNKRENNEQPQGKVSLRKLLAVAIKAAENGGEKVVETKDNLQIQTKGLTKEGMQDRVTTADFLSHCTMIATIRQMYPSIRVISEEAKTSCINNKSVNYLPQIDTQMEELSDQIVNEEDVTVWIDPLDATQEYTEKLYKFVTTMVCVAVKGKPIIGVVHKPFSRITSWAWEKHATSDDLPTKFLPSKKNDEKIKIIVSRSHQGEIKKILEQNFKNIDLIVAAGAGYKALEVATGQVEAYLHTTAIKKWDICAGNAILNTLGGKMTNKYGKEIDYLNYTDAVNKDGLVATLRNQEDYIGKL